MPSSFPFRLAAIDLDGTLLGPDSTVGKRNRAAVQTLVEAGVVVVLASGRMHASMLRIHDELGLDTPIVSYNGSMVVDPQSGETLLHCTLAAAIAQDIVAWGESAGKHLNYYIDDTLYVDRESPWSDLYHRRTGSAIVPVGSLHRFDGQSPTKVIFVGEPAETLRYQAEWKERLGDRAYMVRTMPEYLEFLNPGADKSSGVAAVARRYGIAAEDVAAFGDSPNDIPMLEGAGLAVVMPSAHEEVLAHADFVPTGSPEDAFACALEALGAPDGANHR